MVSVFAYQHMWKTPGRWQEAHNTCLCWVKAEFTVEDKKKNKKHAEPFTRREKSADLI